MFQKVHIADVLEELEDDIGSDGGLGAVRRPSEPAPPVGDVPVRVLGFENGLDRIHGVL